MSLKVFDLRCAAGHVFEGWFASHADYDAQHERGLISCPLCGDSSVSRMLSAPRLNVSGARAPAHEPVPAPTAPVETPQAQAQLMQHLRKLIRDTENVGQRFADEARRIHHGDAPERAIRGVASAQERQALAEEGIAVAGIPAVLDDDRLQ